MKYDITFKHHETKEWLGKIDGDVLPAVGDMILTEGSPDHYIEVLWRIFIIPTKTKGRIYTFEVEMLCQVVRRDSI